MHLCYFSLACWWLVEVGAEVHHRDRKGEPWDELQVADYFDNDRLMPYRFDADDPNILIVTTRELSREALQIDELEGLYRFDLTRREIIGDFSRQCIAHFRAIEPDGERIAGLLQQDVFNIGQHD